MKSHYSILYKEWLTAFRGKLQQLLSYQNKVITARFYNWMILFGLGGEGGVQLLKCKSWVSYRCTQLKSLKMCMIKQIKQTGEF
jgi:hypothetical protein